MVNMLIYWLGNFAPSNINFFCNWPQFFFPADCVFGNIEQGLKKVSTIITLEDLLSHIDKFGEVISLSESVTIIDFRAALQVVIKMFSSWPFQICKMKRILFHRNTGSIQVKGEPHYNTSVNTFHSLFVSKKTPADIRLATIGPGVAVKQEKKRDVASLLEKHFGKTWRSIGSLTFYKNIVDNAPTDDDADPVEPPTCSFMEEHPELIV